MAAAHVAQQKAVRAGVTIPDLEATIRRLRTELLTDIEIQLDEIGGRLRRGDVDVLDDLARLRTRLDLEARR